MESLTALLTLTALEIVLGIDNIIFIAILVQRLPKDQQNKARQLGISLALIMRVALLLSLSWIMGLTEPLITLFQKSFSGRDLILIFGGLFLVAKSTFEIHHKVEGDPEKEIKQKASHFNSSQFGLILGQILMLDIVFSLDSVITAVGMAQEVWIMMVAMIAAVIVMLFSAKAISDFVEHYPTIKILALAFLLLIGVMLLVEGMGGHVSKGYIYFAMTFSLVIEFLNMRYQKNQKSKRA